MVATGNGTLGGTICSIQIQCLVAPCQMDLVVSVGGAGSVGGRMFATGRDPTGCGPAVLGCTLTVHTSSAGGPVTITCDASSAPGVAVAVELYCSGRAF